MITLAPDQAARIAAHLRALHVLRGAGGLGFVDGWSVFTDGWALIAIEADLGFGEWSAPHSPTISGDMVRKILAAPLPEGRAASIEALRTFALQDMARTIPAPCPVCAGVFTAQVTCAADSDDRECVKGQATCACPCGARSHTIPCDECNGVGWTLQACPACGPTGSFPVLRGVIGDGVFNLTLLAEGLRFAPVATVDLTVTVQAGRDAHGRGRDGNQLRLVADGYHYLQMGLYDEPGERQADTPRFNA